MNFAIRIITSDNLFAVIPIRAKRNNEELAEAMLWDAIDTQHNPYCFEFSRLTVEDNGEGGKWKIPGEWRKFEKTSGQYQELLDAEK